MENEYYVLTGVPRGASKSPAGTKTIIAQNDDGTNLKEVHEEVSDQNQLVSQSTAEASDKTGMIQYL